MPAVHSLIPYAPSVMWANATAIVLITRNIWGDVDNNAVHQVFINRLIYLFIFELALSKNCLLSNFINSNNIIEQAQNFSAKYQDNITISLMVRQALYFLPEAIKDFEKNEPGVQITPLFQYENGIDSFLKNESDIVFALEEQTKQLAGTTVHTPHLLTLLPVKGSAWLPVFLMTTADSLHGFPIIAKILFHVSSALIKQTNVRVLILLLEYYRSYTTKLLRFHYEPLPVPMSFRQ